MRGCWDYLLKNKKEPFQIKEIYLFTLEQSCRDRWEKTSAGRCRAVWGSLGSFWQGLERGARRPQSRWRNSCGDCGDKWCGACGACGAYRCGDSLIQHPTITSAPWKDQFRGIDDISRHSANLRIKTNIGCPEVVSSTHHSPRRSCRASRTCRSRRWWTWGSCRRCPRRAGSWTGRSRWRRGLVSSCGLSSRTSWAPWSQGWGRPAMSGLSVQQYTRLAARHVTWLVTWRDSGQAAWSDTSCHGARHGCLAWRDVTRDSPGNTPSVQTLT